MPRIADLAEVVASDRARARAFSHSWQTWPYVGGLAGGHKPMIIASILDLNEPRGHSCVLCLYGHQTSFSFPDLNEHTLITLLFEKLCDFVFVALLIALVFYFCFRHRL